MSDIQLHEWIGTTTMPYSIAFYNNGAYRKLWGLVSKTDIRQSFIELHERPEYNQFVCILHDHSEMTGRDWGQMDIILLGANHLGASSGNLKLIDLIVTTDQDLVEMLRNSVVTQRLPNPIQYFTSLADGKKRFAEITGKSID